MLEQYFNKLGEQLIKDISASLDAKGLTNTGETKASIRYDAKEDRFTLYGAGQLMVLEDGAKPLQNKTGGFIEAITEWGKTKLQLNDKDAKSFAYAYYKKRKGTGIAGLTTAADGSYVVPNPYNVGSVLSDTINKDLITEIQKNILTLSASVIKEEISKSIRAFRK